MINRRSFFSKVFGAFAAIPFMKMFSQHAAWDKWSKTPPKHIGWKQVPFWVETGPVTKRNMTKEEQRQFVNKLFWGRTS
jgi:hypothetical protein